MSAEFVATVEYNTNHSNPTRFIISHILRHPVVAIILILGAAGNAALAAIVPNFIGQAFDAMKANPDEVGLKVVGTMALAIVLAQVVRGFIQLSRNFASETFAQRFERDVRDELYASLLGKSMKYHDMMPVGEIMARVTNDVREMNYMMNPGVNMLIGSGFFLLAPLIAAPLIHPDLLLVPLSFVTVHVVVQWFFIRSLHPIAQKVRTSFGWMNAHLAESLDGLEVVKGTAQEKQESERFNVLADDVRDHFVHQGAIEARYLSYLLMALTVVAGFIHAITLYQAGEIAVGDIVNFTYLLGLFGFPVFTSLFALSRIASGHASAGRILDVINAQTDLDRNTGGYNEPVKGSIKFENVCFGYLDGKGKEVLCNIDFYAKPGQTVAIVGQTGSGKSTITKLINRIYDTQQGRILVDDVDVRDWNLASLRSQISIIEQDIFLFSRTVGENISFGDQNAGQEKIEEAGKKAQAHKFIMESEDGYETVIGQRGMTLSGGQRQRLALARAFVTNPPVLILDDSTSAIDSATEDRIQQAIWSASQGRTTILITHRLSQIRWADHIVVLRQGGIVAQGTHDELMESSDAYRRIFARYD
jgi:ATP-binding cassette, subfamily B, bacterial